MNVLVQHDQRPDQARYTRVGDCDRDEEYNARGGEVEQDQDQDELPECRHCWDQPHEATVQIS